MRTALAAWCVAFGAGAAIGAAPQATFRSQVSAVRLDVLVTNGGRPVAGLTGADFEVIDNGVRQAVSVVSGEQPPLDVVFALDRSDSVAGETLERLKEAVSVAARGLRAVDRAALLTFSQTLVLDARLEEWPATFADAVRRVSAGGATAAVDAVFAALSVAEGTGRRTLVLLFSDGFDNRSWLTPSEVVRAARESEVVICGVAFVPKTGRPAQSSAEPHVELLRRLSEATGGEVFTTERGADLAPAFERLLASMRARYLLSYSASGVDARGWHEVKVRLTRARGTVIVRPGYRVK